MTNDEAEKKLNTWLAPLATATQVSHRRTVRLLGLSLGGTEADAVRMLVEGDPITVRAMVESLEQQVQEAGHAGTTVRRHGTVLSSLAKFLGRDLGIRRVSAGRPPGPRPAGPEPDEGYARRQVFRGRAADLVDALLASLPSLQPLASRMGLTVGETLAELLRLASEETARGSRHARAVAREAAVLASDEIRDRGHRRPPSRTKGGESVAPTSTPKGARVMSEYEIDKFIVGPELERQAAERAAATAREVDPCSN